MTIRMEHAQDASPADREAIEDRLGAFNVAQVGYNDWGPCTMLLRDDDDQLRGGLLAHVWGRWLHVTTIWVDETLRRQGHASRLLAAAEAWAAEHGAVGAFLDTFTFQAGPGFYERRGYRVFGVMEDHPPGHASYFLRKRFSR